ncbi:pyridoxal phosphate-dependent aminotransferase [Paenibacillus sp. URB8-2]|uniref:pyridoxal phosphate-dependent aminotransferase n=1 Tax=Paenibacillus sp. URB8-2 TaxID=2741301 RepID=UPI0015C01DCE|nr:pyridoxal phosphate-dependent aminotransferase [Paenibacillus sp. URB8-2]BCG61132.1 aspartate aminotransferase [Paenibacillus sp. URB8-2]
MKELSSKIANIEPAKIRKMYDMAQGLDNVISFVIGEPEFDTPQHIIDAAKKAMDHGHTHYTPNSGILPLREAVSTHFKDFDKVSYNPLDEIMITVGGMQGLYLSLLVLTNPGDEVIVSDPCYTNYYGMIEMNHAIPVTVPVYEEEGFNFTEKGLREALTPRSKAILLNTPSNPTGAVADRETIEMIARIAIENDLYVIFDEVYKYLTYDEEAFFNIARIPGMKERTIIVDSVSKSYAMTGWRVGFCLGPEHVISQMQKIQEFMLSCVNTPAQYAAIEALTGPQDALTYMNEQYKQRRKIMVDRINSIDTLSCLMPKGAFYIFMNIKETGLTSEEFAIELLKDQHVVLSPGDCFGAMGEGYVRLSYATSVENINEGFDRIEKFVKKLSERRVPNHR